MEKLKSIDESLLFLIFKDSYQKKKANMI